MITAVAAIQLCATGNKKPLGIGKEGEATSKELWWEIWGELKSNLVEEVKEAVKAVNSSTWIKIKGKKKRPKAGVCSQGWIFPHTPASTLWRLECCTQSTATPPTNTLNAIKVKHRQHQICQHIQTRPKTITRLCSPHPFWNAQHFNNHIPLNCWLRQGGTIGRAQCEKSCSVERRHMWGICAGALLFPLTVLQPSQTAGQRPKHSWLDRRRPFQLAIRWDWGLETEGPIPFLACFFFVSTKRKDGPGNGASSRIQSTVFFSLLRVRDKSLLEYT